jgi:hypothetical protein
MKKIPQARERCNHCGAEWWHTPGSMIDRRDHARPDGRNCLVGTRKARQPKSRRTPAVDVMTTDHGSLVTASPITGKARRFFQKNLAGALCAGGDAIAIEHRFAYAVCATMLDAGLALQRSSDGAIARGKVRA